MHFPALLASLFALSTASNLAGGKGGKGGRGGGGQLGYPRPPPPPVAALSSSSSPPACTKTLTPTSYPCCDDIAAQTATIYTDCGGCAVETFSNFPACRCASPPALVATMTTTETLCFPSVTATATGGFTTMMTTTTGNCTSTITKTKPACGDCGHVYATTSTAWTNCGGCAALETKMVEPAGAGLCACPTESVTTVTSCGTMTTPVTPAPFAPRVSI